MINIHTNQQGQGLLETIVALGIIITGVVGMLNLTLSNQSASLDAKERLIATNTAREGIEIVRSIRDTNWLNCTITGGVSDCNTWDQDLVSGTDVTAVPLFDIENNTWTIDFTANDFTHDHVRVWRKSSGAAANIGAQFQSTQSDPSDSILTPYRRIVELYSICLDKTISTNCSGSNPKIGILVQSKVQWDTNERVNEIIVEERVFNWR
jgi:Tfp pilus assembly protein PilV